MDENKTNTNESNNKNMMMVIGAVVVIALVGLFIVKGTSKNGDQMKPSENTEQQVAAEPTTESTTPAVENTDVTGTAMNDTDKVTTIDMEAGSFYYKPNIIKAKKGEKIKVVMTSKDMMHDFNIDELKVKMPITKSGNTSTVEFTASKTGTFEYYCSVGKHRLNGQVGKLIVE